MKDAYTKLMVQQHTTPEGDAAFYKKLENELSIREKRIREKLVYIILMK